jgi:hypothetical protein
MVFMGVLKIGRSSQWVNRLRKIKILVDGTPAGAVAHGETLELSLPAGTHQVSAKLDWCRTDPLSVDIPRNGIVDLELGCNAKPTQSLRALYLVLFASRDYLYLRAASAAKRF